MGRMFLSMRAWTSPTDEFGSAISNAEIAASDLQQHPRAWWLNKRLYKIVVRSQHGPQPGQD